MSKIGKLASDTLSRLLYATKSQQIAGKLDSVTRYLYEHEPHTNKSLLDDLLENDWKQKPLVEVLNEPRLQQVPKSNVLKFNCANSYISTKDFQSLFPINRDRQYLLKNEYSDGFVFQSIKSRNPTNLMFQNCYYLIFQNYIQAAVYYMETLNKSINGVGLQFEFMNLNETHLKNIISPYLGAEACASPVKFSPDLLTWLNSCPQKLHHAKTLLSLPKNDYKSMDPFNNYQVLSLLTDYNARAVSVLTKNLPFGLSKHTLPRLLWDYDLARSNPIIPLINDPPRELSLNLIRFQSSNCANRFVRNFHGKRWDAMQHHQKEKKLYDPILCEVLEQ